MENSLLCLSSIGPYFHDFIHYIVFDLFSRCVTVETTFCGVQMRHSVPVKNLPKRVSVTSRLSNFNSVGDNQQFVSSLTLSTTISPPLRTSCNDFS